MPSPKTSHSECANAIDSPHYVILLTRVRFDHSQLSTPYEDPIRPE